MRKRRKKEGQLGQRRKNVRRCCQYQYQGTSVSFPAVSSRLRTVNKRRITILSKEGSGTKGVGVPAYKGMKGHVHGKRNEPQPWGNVEFLPPHRYF